MRLKQDLLGGKKNVRANRLTTIMLLEQLELPQYMNSVLIYKMHKLKIYPGCFEIEPILFKGIVVSSNSFTPKYNKDHARNIEAQNTSIFSNNIRRLHRPTLH